ncbi:MAG: delta-60 repeat domain-containing protein, partial [Tepidisphaeraceae bacterium]
MSRNHINHRSPRLESLEPRLLMAAGALDKSFSSDGKATVDIGARVVMTARDVAVQSDGKTVIAGIATESGKSEEFVVARLNLDGSPDVTFGPSGTGIVRTDVSGGRDFAACVAIQPDGKIVVAGDSAGRFGVVRYLSNGSLDKTFNGDGKLTIDFDFFGANDIALQSDGKIVLVGATLSGAVDFAVARLNENGLLDGSFDGDGKKVIGFGSRDVAEAVTIDGAGNIIVAGRSGEFGAVRIAITRLKSNGAKDGTFGDSGIVLTSFPGQADAVASDIILQSGGKIVVVGETGDESSKL